MKIIQFFCFTFLLTSNIYSLAQNLESEFNEISTNNEMMGGSLVIFCEDGIIENLAIGKSDYNRNIDMSVNTKYRIASISKTITAIAIMQLVEQNLLDLDEDISSILGYTVQNPHNPTIAITPRMLLSHTSTLIDGSTYNNFLDATVNDNPIPNLGELLKPSGMYYNSSQFNNTVPGTYFNYSNTNYVVLGTIVEKVSGLRFDIYCKQNISNPLGIDASFNVNDLSDINQLAVLYRKSSGTWTPQVDDYQGVQPVFDNLSGYIPGTNGGRFGPQGGFRCSAIDLAKIFLVLMNNGTYDGVSLLSQSSCDAMFDNEWTYNGSNGNNYFGLFRSWGLGIHRITSTPNNDIALPESTTMLGHAGEAYGLVSDAFFDKDRKIGFVFMNNGVGIGYQTNDNSIFYTIEQEVFNAIEDYGNIASCSESEPLGFTQNQLSNKLIYPNPCEDFINIPQCSSSTRLHIRIFSLDGRIIKTLDINNGKRRINVKDLKKGRYIIKLNDNSYTFIKH